MNKKVSIIVPIWYNDDAGYEMTRRSINSLLTTDYDNMEVILVDDFSPHKRQNDIRDEFTGRVAMIIDRNKNGGSTEAVNTGILFATGDFIQYQNNDTEFPHFNWLQEQMRLFDDESVGVVGSLLRYPNGLIQHAGACWRALETHVIDHIGQHQKEIKYCEDVPFVTGCGMTVRKEILQRNGGFTVFQGYGWDDIDIQVKAKQWGWKVKVAPKSQFTHYGSISYSQRSDLATPENYLVNSMKFAEIPIETEETIRYFQAQLYQ